MSFNFKEYMLDCATRLKDVGHTEDQLKFFRVSSIGHLDEVLSNLSNIEFPALLIQDNMEGNLGDHNTSNNYIDTPYYVFYIIKHVGHENHDQREEAKKECKTIGFKMLSKMVNDKRNLIHGLTFLQFVNIPYQTIGPIGDNCFGVMFSFSVSDNANLVYNANDWNL